MTRDGPGEDVPDTGCMLAQNVRVDAQGHGWVGVAKPGRHDVYRNPGEKQRGRVQVVQIVHVGGAWLAAHGDAAKLPRSIVARH